MRWLLVKDLQILRRSPLLAGVLVVYPVAIALMIGVALSSPPGKPTVAFDDEVPTGHATVSIGAQRIDVGAYARELLRSVRPLHASSRSAAIADVRSGRALAAVIIPADLPGQIESLITQGVGHPTVQVVLNTRNPLQRRFAQDALLAREASVQADVSRRVLQVATSDLQRVLSGGSVSLLGQTVHLLGLRDTRLIVEGSIASLPRRSVLRAPLAQVAAFASTAIAGLGFAQPVLGSIGTPLTVQQTDLAAASTPSDAYGAEIAVVVSLMFIAMLLAASLLASERSEQTFARLVPGLVSRWTLLASKVVLAGCLGGAVGLVLSACVGGFVGLSFARLGLWACVLVVGGAGFAALGVLLGAVARELAAASLLAFLVSLPVAFLALVPGSGVSGGMSTALRVVSFLFPFRATLSALGNAFTGASPSLWPALAHVAVLAVVYVALAGIALRRWAAGV